MGDRMEWEGAEMPDRQMTRRETLMYGFAGAAFICSFDKDAFRGPVRNVTAASKRRKLAATFDPFQRDVPIAPVLRPVQRTKSLERYVVSMRAGKAQILPGLETPITGYEGLYPGPTIRARRGRKAEVTQRNEGGEPMTVHLHGGVTPWDSDGHPEHEIPVGGERLYHYPNVQHGATLWYHDHGHGRTARTLYSGLAGFYIVEDPDELDLELPQGEYDVPLMLQDRSFNADGTLRYALDLDKGFRGDTILVNGAISPRMRVERRLYRLRFLNAANARAFELKLGNGREMIQIGSDGGLLPRPVKRTVIPLEPAERVDVLIDFRKFGAGSELILHNRLGEASTTAVMRFDVVRGGREEARVPRVLRKLEKIPAPTAERTFPLTFQGTAGSPQWTIDGLSFGMSRIDCRPRLGTTELWHFVNNSERVHPMHMHGYHFRVISQGGKRPHPADRAWKDTVRVLPNERVTVQPYFDRYAGRYVFHCHAAEHGDGSMMNQMEVVV